MNRRMLDIAVPLLYVVALLVADLLRNAAVVGGVAVIGAVLVGLYFAAIRQNIRA